MKKWLLVVACCVGLTGCLQSTVPVQNLPEITFQHLPRIALDVASIEVVDQSKSGMAGKHVEHLFPTSPKTAINNWVRDRLNANGPAGVARFIINDASAIEEKLKKKSGITGMFTNDQSERYSVNTDVRLEIYDRNQNLTGYTEAKANRHTTLAEDASLLDREKVWFELVEKTMADLDKTMVSNMNKFLSAQ